MDLLYFDFDHGRERLLFVSCDEPALAVRFRLESGPDPTYDQELEHEPVDVSTVTAETRCDTREEFAAFCCAFASAMRDTPFRLQDPAKPAFTSRPHAQLDLSRLGPTGIPPATLRARVPRSILDALLPEGHLPPSLAALR